MRTAPTRKRTTPAQALLLALARGERPALRPVDRDPDSDALWREAVGLAERNGIAPLLHEEAQAGRLAWLPEGARRELRAARIAELGREERRARVLARALQALNGAGGRREIPVLLLKGAASARTIYPAPELRPRSDLDLLVSPQDREEALSRLALRGYRQHPKTRGTPEDEGDWHERTLLDPIDREQQLDLHFGLAQAERHRLTADRLLAASIAEPALGAGARILPAEEAALVCAHSLAIHELSAPLISLCDLARLLARADLERLALLAREARLVRALYTAVFLLASLGPAASRSSSLFARAAPCGRYSLCGGPVDPAKLGLLLGAAALSLPTRRLLQRAAVGYDLSRAPLSRARQLWRKALFIDQPRDVARFAVAHALRSLRRAASAG